jgi:hypothetical protein
MHVKQTVADLRAAVTISKTENNPSVCLSPDEVTAIADVLERIKQKSDRRKKALRDHHKAYNELRRLYDQMDANYRSLIE